MATAAAKKYGQGAVYGSLAYDFNHPELYQEEYSAPRTPAAKPRTETQTKVRTRARTAVRTRQGISPMAILGCAVAAFLMIIAITAQITLFDVSGQNVALTTQLAELETEQAKLRIAYESAFNLAEVETYAISELGMQKPSADQIYYIDTSAPDKAVVIADGASETFAERAADFFTGFRAYFG